MKHMKKIMWLLLALPLMAVMTSCHDDDDLPDVILTVNYENAINYDDVLYVVRGDTLKIDSVAATPATPQGKAVQLLGVSYRWNGWLLGTTLIPPFSATIATDNFEPADYILGMECPVIQIDKTPGTAFITRKVRIVASEEDLPSAVDPASRHRSGVTVVTSQLSPR